MPRVDWKELQKLEEAQVQERFQSVKLDEIIDALDDYIDAKIKGDSWDARERLRETLRELFRRS